ncbi:MAG: hypothetical protein AAB345_01400 [Patescibacteria group bacterium]
MDAYTAGFVTGSVFGAVAMLVLVLVRSCLVWVPKNPGAVKIMDPEKIRKMFEENEKHKVLRPYTKI